MRTIFNACLVLASIHIVGSCASTPKQSAPKEKKPAKVAVKEVKPLPPPPVVKETDDPGAWVTKMLLAETEFTLKDRQYVLAMPPAPKPGSLAEAALAVGLLRDILTPPGGSATFKEVDIQTTAQPIVDDKSVLPKQNTKIDEARLIERRAREKGLDLVGALATNPFLKSITVFNWAWNAGAMDGNSDLFKQNVMTVVKSEAMLWQEIAKKSGAIAVIATPAPSPETAAPPPAEPAKPAENLHPAAVNAMANAEAEKLLAIAQEAAAQENYAKAVAESSKIPSTAVNYTIAQESVRLWSNRAVTDLRKKAAFEYRAAASVTDSASKKAYLMKAKAYLEDALKSYPAASNLDTVQDNLGMIKKELEN